MKNPPGFNQGDFKFDRKICLTLIQTALENEFFVLYDIQRSGITQ